MLLLARGTGSLAQPHYAVSSASSACLISAFGAFRFKTIKSPPAASGRPDRAFIRADAVASSLRICEPAPVAAAGGRRHPCEESADVDSHAPIAFGRDRGTPVVADFETELATAVFTSRDDFEAYIAGDPDDEASGASVGRGALAPKKIMPNPFGVKTVL